MGLLPNELKEWIGLKKKSKKYGIKIKRVGPANISFGKTGLGGSELWTQLGTGRATRIMNARINLLKKK
jgi:hypothetical protein